MNYRDSDAQPAQDGPRLPALGLELNSCIEDVSKLRSRMEDCLTRAFGGASTKVGDPRVQPPRPVPDGKLADLCDKTQQLHQLSQQCHMLMDRFESMV